jgi:hypothetical protein
MKWRDPSEEERDRMLALIYSPTGKGKTVSTVKSLPQPFVYYECEPKPLDRTCKGNVPILQWIKEGKVKHGRPESYDDFKDNLVEMEDEIISNYKAVFIDGLSYFMRVELLGEIQVETAKADVFESKKRDLVNMGRTDKAGYGAIASLMNRITGVIGNVAAQGVIVVITALQADDPTWNRELAAGPALAGKKFAEDMPGFFDLIGKVTSKVKEKKVDNVMIEKIVYPPVVWFESDKDEAFTAKWSGPPLKKPYFPLDWKKILAYDGT